MTLKKSWPTVLAIGAPLVIVVIVALAVLLPQLSLRPQSNFVYSIEDQNYPNYGYPAVMPDRQMDFFQPAPPPEPTKTVKTYLYDFKTNTSRLITNLNLDQPDPGAIILKQQTSTDGYTVEARSVYSDNIFSELADGNRSTQVFLVKNGRSRKLNITLNYSQNFVLVGWESPAQAYGKK